MRMSFSSKAVTARAIFATLLLACLLVTGCSDNPYPPGETSKDIRYFVLTGMLKHMDPVVAYFVDEGAVIDNVYTEFYKYDQLKRNPLALDLSLGASEATREPYPFVDKSGPKPVRRIGEAWTFHIKHGLHFQDDPCFPGGKGREIFAADFIYAFRRMADPRNNCPIVNYLSDKILGFSDYMTNGLHGSGKHATFDYSMPVEGLQIDPKDPYTFRILLNQPYPQLRYLMAMHFTAPIPHEAIEKYHDLDNHMVGCGQYVMTEFDPRRSIVLKVNPNRPKEYYPTDGTPEQRANGLLADAGKLLPLTDEVHYVFIKEQETSWNFFLEGYLDTAGVSNNNFRQVVAQQGMVTPEMARKGVVMRQIPALEIDYYAFNMQDTLVGGKDWASPKKIALRQAIALALNSQQFIDIMNQGVGIPAQGVVPPGIFGYDPNYKNPNRQFDRSLSKAKQLLAQAGYPGGIDPSTQLPLQLNYDNASETPAQRQQTELLRKQFAALGINLVSRNVSENVLQDKQNSGQFQFCWSGWIADYPDPENFFLLFYSKNMRPGPNISGYTNPDFDKLYEQMRSMNDGPQRLAVIEKMRDMLASDCPVIFDQHPVSLSLYYSWLQNDNPNPVAMDTIQYQRIDGALRARREAEWNRPVYWPVVAFFSLLILGSIPALKVVNNRRTRYIRKSTGE